MRRETTKLAWGEKIARVHAYLADRLDDDLDLDRLAEVACSSRFHFHRSWQAVTGETLADVIRRMRLHRAAVQLIQSDAAMITIAKTSGYGSVAAFSRVFQSFYGVPPARYRSTGRLVPPQSSTSSMEQIMEYAVEIRNMARVRLLCADHQGPYPEIGHAFEHITAHAFVHGLFKHDARMIGVFFDDCTVVPADKLRSAAGISVDPEVQASDGFRILELEGVRCAVLHHVGPYAELPKAYDWLFGTWMPRNGMEPADRPCFEEYLNNPKELPPAEWRTDICVPLA